MNYQISNPCYFFALSALLLISLMVFWRRCTKLRKMHATFFKYLSIFMSLITVVVLLIIFNLGFQFHRVTIDNGTAVLVAPLKKDTLKQSAITKIEVNPAGRGGWILEIFVENKKYTSTGADKCSLEKIAKALAAAR